MGRLTEPYNPLSGATLHSIPSNIRFLNQSRPFADQTHPANVDIAAVLPSRAVGSWLLLSSVLVLGIIVVGGVTRLTESGLSITEWRPITGILPPLSHDEWMVEFDKYKTTPEFKLYVTYFRVK